MNVFQCIDFPGLLLCQKKQKCQISLLLQFVVGISIKWLAYMCISCDSICDDDFVFVAYMYSYIAELHLSWDQMHRRAKIVRVWNHFASSRNFFIINHKLTSYYFLEDLWLYVENQDLMTYLVLVVRLQPDWQKIIS